VTAPSLREVPLRILPAPMLRARYGGLGGKGSAHLIERHARVYRHTWMVLLSGVFEPVFYLLSIGVGLGHLVGRVAGPGGQLISFTSFVGPALLATSSMNGAIFDSTYNVFFRMRYDKLYDSALATPMRPSDVALGEIGWALIRGGLYAAAFLAVMLVMGLVHSAWAIAVLPVALLIGFAFAAVGLAATAYMRNMQQLEFVALASLPMFLFSTTFYPLSVYPRAIQVVVECTPLYQGVVLLRSLTLGVIGPGLLWHAAYLALMGLAGLQVAARRISRLLLK
jgi:lipooligosaccharide transport system permease protein